MIAVPGAGGDCWKRLIVGRGDNEYSERSALSVGCSVDYLELHITKNFGSLLPPPHIVNTRGHSFRKVNSTSLRVDEASIIVKVGYLNNLSIFNHYYRLFLETSEDIPRADFVVVGGETLINAV